MVRLWTWMVLLALPLCAETPEDRIAGLRQLLKQTKPEQPLYWTAALKLAETEIASSDPKMLKEAESLIGGALKRDANSWDARRLAGDLAYRRAQLAVSARNAGEAGQRLKQAIDEYTRANTLKPGEGYVPLQIARAWLMAGNYAEAEKGYRAMIERDRLNPQLYAELYAGFVAQKKFPAGEKLLQEGIAAAPKSFDLLALLLSHYVQLSRKADAERVAAQLRSHAGEYPNAWLLAGDAELRLGSAEKALVVYREGLAGDPKRELAYRKRILEATVRLNKPDEAAALSAELLRKSPGDPDALAVRAAAEIDRGKPAAAIATLRPAVTAQSPLLHYQMGRALAATYQFDAAREHLARSVQLRPTDADARVALARVLVEQKRYAAAEDAVRGLETEPAQLVLAAALLGMDRMDEARSRLAALLKRTPNFADALELAGRVELADRQPAAAERLFRRLLQTSPADPRGAAGLADAIAQQKNLAAAIAAVEAMSASPIVLGNLYARKQDWPRAAALFEKAANENGPQRGDAWLRLGEVYRRQQQYDRAIAALENARKLLPDHPVVLNTLALTLESAGRKSEARDAYFDALRVNPEVPGVLNGLARMIAETGGNLDSALSLAARARKLAPSVLDVQDTVGMICLKRNATEEAVRIYSGLVTKDPKSATFLYRLGTAQMKKGDKPAAAKSLEAALNAASGAAEREGIQKLLAQLGAR